MNIKRKLINPFVLGLQGFGLGALLLGVTTPEADSPNTAQPVQSAAAAAITSAA